LGDGGVVASELELMFPTKLYVNHLQDVILLADWVRPCCLG
jgi:hypothetical protein